MRATSRLSSPAWFAQPMKTSSTSVASTCVGGDELREHVGGEVVGADAGELPAVAAERRAQRAGDHGLPHGRSSA